MGLFLSLSVGAGAAVTGDNLDTSVRGVKDVRALLSVPPLAAIPHISTQAERRDRRRKRLMGWIGGATGLAALLAVEHFFVRPLDVVWLSLLQRFGM